MSQSTRRVYEIDVHLSSGLPSLPIASLRALARRVWRNHGKGQMPKIVAGDGFRRPRLSYYQEGGLIVMARNQRNVVVILHELAHALDDDVTHGRGFQNRYADLLGRYLRLPDTTAKGKS